MVECLSTWKTPQKQTPSISRLNGWNVQNIYLKYDLLFHFFNMHLVIDKPSQSKKLDVDFKVIPSPPFTL